MVEAWGLVVDKTTDGVEKGFEPLSIEACNCCREPDMGEQA
jgi:hypothetical protein